MIEFSKNDEEYRWEVGNIDWIRLDECVNRRGK